MACLSTTFTRIGGLTVVLNRQGGGLSAQFSLICGTTLGGVLLLDKNGNILTDKNGAILIAKKPNNNG